MKKSQAKAAATAAAPQKNRTVKVKDDLHHRVQMQAVRLRIPLQSFVEQMLEHGLASKVYETFVSKKAAA